MREALAPYLGRRIVVQATVRRLSWRCVWAGVRESTVLLGPVAAADGDPLCDHLWMPIGRRLAALDLHTGDVVRFDAHVATYRRGLRRLPGEPARFTIEYGLAFPTRCAVVDRAPKPESAPPPGPQPKPPAMSARLRILTALGALRPEGDEPPSLSNLFAHAGVAPTSFLKQLQKMARAGAIAFSPDGHLILPSTPEGGAQS